MSFKIERLLLFVIEWLLVGSWRHRLEFILDELHLQVLKNYHYNDTINYIITMMVWEVQYE